jgi:hypothetical protein
MDVPHYIRFTTACRARASFAQFRQWIKGLGAIVPLDGEFRADLL